MKLKSIALATSLVGAGLTAPALAQETSPMLSAEDAAAVALFEQTLAATPGAPLASETALTTLLGQFPALFSVDVGSFSDEAGGQVAHDVEITVPLGESPIGFRIGELRVFGLDDNELAKLSGNETADVGRIDLRDVELFGIEQFVSSATDVYMDAIEGAVESMEDGAEADLDVDFQINQYEVSFGHVVLDGFTWHATPSEVNDGIDLLFNGQELTEEQGVWAVFAPLARLQRSLEVDTTVYSDVKVLADVDVSEEGTEQSIVFEYDMPFIGIAGASRGDTALTLYKDLSYNMEMTMSDEEFGGTIPFKMSGSLDLMSWEGLELANLFSYLEAQTVPSTDITDLMSLGSFTSYGETVYFGDELFYSVDRATVDLSDFHWFVPESISFDVDGLTYDIGNYISAIESMMMSVPEVAEDPESAMVSDMFQQVAVVLADNGVDVLNMDLDFGLSWDADSGATALSFEHVMDGFGELALGFSGSLPNFEQYAYAIEADEDAGMDEDPFEEIFVESMALSSFEFNIDDDGGLDKLFALTVALAKLMPEEEGGSELAMFANSSPEELRAMASGLTRMSGLQVAGVFPPAVEYVNGFADFLMNGGSLHLAMKPETPLDASSEAAIMGLIQDPDAMVEYLGLEFEYTEPAE